MHELVITAQATHAYEGREFNLRIPLRNLWMLNRWGHPLNPERLQYQIDHGRTSPPIVVDLGTSLRRESVNYVHVFDPQHDDDESWNLDEGTLDASHPTYLVSDGHHRARARMLEGDPDAMIDAVVRVPDVPWYLKGEDRLQMERELAEGVAKLEALTTPRTGALQRRAEDEQVKARVEWRGLPISLEFEGGDSRRPAGPHTVFYPANWGGYGFFEGYAGADGDSLDVILGPRWRDAQTVYLAAQTHDGETFEQFKVMLGFPSLVAAEAAFRLLWPAEWLASVTELPAEAFIGSVLPRITNTAGPDGKPLAKAASTTTLRTLYRSGDPGRAGGFWTPDIEYARYIAPQGPFFAADLDGALVHAQSGSPSSEGLAARALDGDLAVEYEAWDWPTTEVVVLDPSILQNLRRASTTPTLSLSELVRRAAPPKPQRRYWGKAGAGILFVCREDGTALLTLRSSRVNEPGTWGVPGGAIDPDDGDGDMGSAITEGAEREVREELGGLPAGARPAGDTTFNSGQFTYTTLIREISAEEKARWTPTIRLNWENDRAEWFPLHRPPASLHFGAQFVLEKLAPQSGGGTPAKSKRPRTTRGPKGASWYHGGPKAKTNFDGLDLDRDRGAQDLNAEGPGVYLTSRPEEAAQYGIVHEVALDPTFRALPGWSGPPKRAPVEGLVRALVAKDPERAYAMAANYGEEGPAGIRAMLKSVLDYSETLGDAMVAIYHDLYQYDAATYAEAFRALGYDGFVVDKNGGQHLVVLNPSKLRVVNVAADTGRVAARAPKRPATWDKGDGEITGQMLGMLYHAGPMLITRVDPEKLQANDAGYYGEGFYVANDAALVEEYGPVVSTFELPLNARVLTAHVELKQSAEGLVDAVEAFIRDALLQRAAEAGADVDAEAEVAEELKLLRKNQIEWMHRVDDYALAAGFDAIAWSPSEIVVKHHEKLLPRGALAKMGSLRRQALETAQEDPIEQLIDQLAAGDIAYRQQLETAAQELTTRGLDDQEVARNLTQIRRRQKLERGLQDVPGATYVGETARHWVYKITDWAGARALGTTNWCIVREQSFWDSYASQGITFYFYVDRQKGAPAAYAVATNPQGAQEVYDQNDTLLDVFEEDVSHTYQQLDQDQRTEAVRVRNLQQEMAKGTMPYEQALAAVQGEEGVAPAYFFGAMLKHPNARGLIRALTLADLDKAEQFWSQGWRYYERELTALGYVRYEDAVVMSATFTPDLARVQTPQNGYSRSALDVPVTTTLGDGRTITRTVRMQPGRPITSEELGLLVGKVTSLYQEDEAYYREVFNTQVANHLWDTSLDPIVQVLQRFDEWAHGGDPYGEAADWSNEGFEPREVRDWLDAGIFDASMAASLQGENVSADDVADLDTSDVSSVGEESVDAIVRAVRGVSIFFMKKVEDGAVVDETPNPSHDSLDAYIENASRYLEPGEYEAVYAKVRAPLGTPRYWEPSADEVTDDDVFEQREFTIDPPEEEAESDNGELLVTAARRGALAKTAVVAVAVEDAEILEDPTILGVGDHPIELARALDAADEFGLGRFEVFTLRDDVPDELVQQGGPADAAWRAAVRPYVVSVSPSERLLQGTPLALVHRGELVVTALETAQEEPLEQIIDQLAGTDMALRQQLETAVQELTARGLDDEAIARNLMQVRRRQKLERGLGDVRGATYVGETERHWVYKITDWEGARALGSENWCIVRGENWWDDYTSNGITFYFYVDRQKGAPATYAVATNPRGAQEVYDQNDTLLDVFEEDMSLVQQDLTEAQRAEAARVRNLQQEMAKGTMPFDQALACIQGAAGVDPHYFYGPLLSHPQAGALLRALSVADRVNAEAYWVAGYDHYEVQLTALGYVYVDGTLVISAVFTPDMSTQQFFQGTVLVDVASKLGDGRSFSEKAVPVRRQGIQDYTALARLVGYEDLNVLRVGDFEYDLALEREYYKQQFNTQVTQVVFGGLRVPDASVDEIARVLERHGDTGLSGGAHAVALEWWKMNLTARDVERWLDAGIFDPAVAAELLKANLDASSLEGLEGARPLGEYPAAKIIHAFWGQMLYVTRDLKTDKVVDETLGVDEDEEAFSKYIVRQRTRLPPGKYRLTAGWVRVPLDSNGPTAEEMTEEDVLMYRELTIKGPEDEDEAENEFVVTAAVEDGGDVVVTLPKSVGYDAWAAEGDAAGSEPTGVEYEWTLGGRPPTKCVPGSRVYVTYDGEIIGYAPLVRIEPRERGYALIRGGGAVAVRLPFKVPGFRGFRYRWWPRELEMRADGRRRAAAEPEFVVTAAGVPQVGAAVDPILGVIIAQLQQVREQMQIDPYASPMLDRDGNRSPHARVFLQNDKWKRAEDAAGYAARRATTVFGTRQTVGTLLKLDGSGPQARLDSVSIRVVPSTDPQHRGHRGFFTPPQPGNGYRPSLTVVVSPEMVLSPDDYVLAALRSTVEHELRHAADWAYTGTTAFWDDRFHGGEKSTGNTLEHWRLYLSNPTELMAWAGNVADRIPYAPTAASVAEALRTYFIALDTGERDADGQVKPQQVPLGDLLPGGKYGLAARDADRERKRFIQMVLDSWRQRHNWPRPNAEPARDYAHENWEAAREDVLALRKVPDALVGAMIRYYFIKERPYARHGGQRPRSWQEWVRHSSDEEIALHLANDTDVYETVTSKLPKNRFGDSPDMETLVRRWRAQSGIPHEPLEDPDIDEPPPSMWKYLDGYKDRPEARTAAEFVVTAGPRRKTPTLIQYDTRNDVLGLEPDPRGVRESVLDIGQQVTTPEGPGRVIDHQIMHGDRVFDIELADGRVITLESGDFDRTTPQRKREQKVERAHAKAKARAEAAGFRTDRVFFHSGGVERADEFNPVLMGARDSGWYGLGYYFTPDIRYARMYGSSPRAFYLKYSNPFRITDENIRTLADDLAAQGVMDSSQMGAWCMKNGYDAVERWREGDYFQEVVVFDRERIRDVNAAFADEGSTKLMATRRAQQSGGAGGDERVPSVDEITPATGTKVPTSLGTFEVVGRKPEQGLVQISYEGGTYGPWIPLAALEHLGDLDGVLPAHIRGATTDDPTVAEVLAGRGEFLGKGNDGAVWRVGDEVVKASTPVPYQPLNAGWLTPQAAADRLAAQVELQNQLAAEGVPGVLTSRLVRVGDKAFQVKPFLTIPESLTREQLDDVARATHALHSRGLALRDAEPFQVGVDARGQLHFFDLGAVAPAQQSKSRHWDEHSREREALAKLYEQHGHEFAPPAAAGLAERWTEHLEASDALWPPLSPQQEAKYWRRFDALGDAMVAAEQLDEAAVEAAREEIKRALEGEVSAWAERQRPKNASGGSGGGGVLVKAGAP